MPPPATLPSPAPTSSPAPGAQTHDGFYLRLQLGGGYTRLSSSMNGTDRSSAGNSTAFAIALGGALTPHVILYGTLLDSTIRDPDNTFSGISPDSSSNHGRFTGSLDAGGFGATGMVGIGVGVAYYLDSNLFVAGSLLASRLFINNTNGGVVSTSEAGFTLEGLVGKEWWVSANWGLGASGRLLLGSMKDRPVANEAVPTWKLAAFAVLFSATYN